MKKYELVQITKKKSKAMSIEQEGDYTIGFLSDDIKKEKAVAIENNYGTTTIFYSPVISMGDNWFETLSGVYSVDILELT